MEDSPTSASASDVPRCFEQSILGTPEPQASSTVNRRQHESFVPFNPKSFFETKSQSPAYLSNVIDGMRRLTDQLDILHGQSEDIKKMPPPIGHQLRKAASIATLSEDRRESIMTESEANSSLGILQLDNIQGFSESEDTVKIAEIMSKFHKEYSLKSLLGKENVEPEMYSSKDVNSRLSLERYENDSNLRRRGSDVSVMSVQSETDSLKSRNSLQLDLRLRLQKALAQRTMDRTSDSIRMSQVSDFYDVDAASINDSVDFDALNQSKDGQVEISVENQATNLVETSSSKSEHTVSPSIASNATFGAANFLSFSNSPVVLDSLTSESFQPADLAMERLAQDENSWRRHFGDLPAVASVAEEGKLSNQDMNSVQNLTQNLDFSAFSGVITGDVTVSSSIVEDVGKRRISVGEYFKLHTEQLGGESGESSDDQRPNFGHTIKSPPKRRPHPPLINLSNAQDVSLDEVPTRDAGLNMTLSSSFADTFNTSSSMTSDAVHHEMKPHSGDDPASRSVDLMPPPPPRTKAMPGNSSAVRDSISSRLSISLSLPRDVDESEIKDLNSSALSLDAGEKIASISQIISVMNANCAGPKSKRQLVDEFMQRCKVSSEKNKLRSNDENLNESPRSSQSTLTNGTRNLKSDTLKKGMKDSTERSQSSNQRVKDWISTISNSKSDSTLENDSMEDAEDLETSKHITKENYVYGIKPSPPLTADSLRQLRSALNDEGMEEKKEKFHETRKGTGRLSNIVYEDEESDTSFMPPPVKAENPMLGKVRLYSTPKGHARKSMLQEVNKEQDSASSLEQYRSLAKKSVESEIKKLVLQHPGKASTNSQESDRQSLKSQGSQNKSSNSKNCSSNSLKMHKSIKQQTNSRHSDSDPKTFVPEWKHHSKGEPRPTSACGSTTSCARSSSRQTDAASITSGPLQIDSTHTQLSWPSVSVGSSLSQIFALRNRAAARVRLLISSPNPAFKLLGERGEVLSEFAFTLHAEETRRIHVDFSPSLIGAIVGKLVIRRVATSESTTGSSEDRRLIALYGYGGMAELHVEGASKDQWAQLFLNMCNIDSDHHSELSDVDTTGDAPEVIATFSVRNSGKVPAFICVQIAPELPFPSCGVYVNPNEMSLSPGEAKHIVVRFDPSHDILQWLSKNANDMQLLGNIWLSWSELATWQRIRRIYCKYYKTQIDGPLSTWGSLYSGELGVGHDLKDNKTAEVVLAQAVRRLKVAVLIERERLSAFDLDPTMIFDQLIANETAMFNSPQWNDITLDTSGQQDSPILSGMANPSAIPSHAEDDTGGQRALNSNYSSPLSSSSGQPKPARNLAKSNLQNDLVIVTNALCKQAQAFSLEFPPTTLLHKSKMKITFQNPSFERNFVTTSSPSSPFTVSTSSFNVPANSYVTVSILFKPTESGTHHSMLNITVDGNHVRSYFLKGEGVAD